MKPTHPESETFLQSRKSGPIEDQGSVHSP
jgi:hypothetical protein